MRLVADHALVPCKSFLVSGASAGSRFVLALRGERPEWQAIVGEMRHPVEDMHIDVWAVSPVVPSPLRPKH